MLTNSLFHLFLQSSKCAQVSYIIVSTLFYLQPSTSSICIDIEFSSLHCFMGNLSPHKLKKIVHYNSHSESLGFESRWLGKHVSLFCSCINNQAIFLLSLFNLMFGALITFFLSQCISIIIPFRGIPFFQNFCSEIKYQFRE